MASIDEGLTCTAKRLEDINAEMSLIHNDRTLPPDVATQRIHALTLQAQVTYVKSMIEFSYKSYDTEIGINDTRGS